MLTTFNALPICGWHSRGQPGTLIFFEQKKIHMPEKRTIKRAQQDKREGKGFPGYFRLRQIPTRNNSFGMVLASVGTRIG